MLSYTLIIIVLGASILGLVSGALGSFAVLRKQSLLGDAISHAALPGICIAFLLTYSKHPLILMTGALAAGWVGTFLIISITRHTTVKQDSALGIILSVFFGLGLVLLTFIQKLPTSKKAGLNSYLFGSASTMLIEDVIIMAILGGITLFTLFLFWKEFKLLSFDYDYGLSLGLPIKNLEYLLTGLIVLAIVIGLQAVGVVLMSAMVIAPAAAARQWTDRLSFMVFLSAFFGALSGVVGAFLSSTISQLPTGPVIVLIMSSIVFISLMFAPNRGLVWAWLRQRQQRDNIREQTMLTNLLLFSETHDTPYHPHDLAALTAIGRGPAVKAMESLEQQGLVANFKDDFWALTKEGYETAIKFNEELDVIVL
jgi:manganese/zinc/iron transport system permease protein